MHDCKPGDTPVAKGDKFSMLKYVRVRILRTLLASWADT